MSTQAVPRRRMNLRAPVTGLVLVLIVVLGGYYGWRAAFGGTEDAAAVPDCSVTSAPTGSAPAAGASPTIGSVAPTTAGPLYLLPGDVTVNVYNATARRGLAVNTAAILKDRGFDVDIVDNDPLEETVPEAAKIRAGTADQPEVQLLLQHVPGAVVVADGRTSLTVDLVLGDTFSALGSADAVTPVPIATARC